MACLGKFTDVAKIREKINPPADCFIPIVRNDSTLSVCGILSVGRTKAGEIIKAPDFPKPVSLGGRCVRYRLSEVLAWVESKRERTAPALDEENL